MKFLVFLSSGAIPIVIILIIIYGIIEKNKVFDTFLEGSKEGLKIVVNIFPTLLGLFLAIGMLRSSGFLELIINILTPIMNKFNIPTQVLPLMLIRPISGSAATAVATDIMKNFGVDSKIGLIASTIMGSTETTLYTIAIYVNSVKIKNIRFVLISALIADIVGMVFSVAFWNMVN